MIQELCRKLNSDIHNDFFRNFNLKNERDYERSFTSLDVIEDCEDAIEEFQKVKTVNTNRTTLYIYGVLQAMYCQQDGLFNLYSTITKDKLKISEFFTKFDFDKGIREVRDDIAGHPTNRKGSEFYFISKGPNTKEKFTYAGYTPEFRKVDVDLNLFIEKQKKFAQLVLQEIKKYIFETILNHKKKFKKMKLIIHIDLIEKELQFIYRGIHSNHPMANFGKEQTKLAIDNLKKELVKRYSENYPQSIIDIFRIQDYILIQIEKWILNNQIEKNIDAEIFMDAFEKNLDDLKEILEEIDNEFNS